MYASTYATFDAAAARRRAAAEEKAAAARERHRVATHEASHAVCAVLSGRPFSAVVLDADGGGKLIGNEPARTAAEVNADAAVSAAGGVGELLLATDLSEFEEGTNWRALALSLMSDGDRRALEISARQFMTEHADAGEPWADPVDLASSTLAKPGAREAVYAVAHALQARGELSEREVLRLVKDCLPAGTGGLVFPA